MVVTPYYESPVFKRFLRDGSAPMNRMTKWFEHGHLPPHLAEVSRRCGELAQAMDQYLPEGAEKTAGLRKLLEAKDCFVRAAIEAAEATAPTDDDPGEEGA